MSQLPPRRGRRPAGSLLLAVLSSVCLAALWSLPHASAGPGGTGYTLVGWNDLGMHCMDADYSVFSILPPFNTIHAQLIDARGNLVVSPGGITVSYQAVADPQGSFNSTSRDKTNFWQFAKPIYGADLAVDQGLAGNPMPGPANVPQPMAFDTVRAWFSAEGIPITPTDDGGRKNPYPMMRLTARDASGTVLATTDIVLPVSDEMDCRICHGSNTSVDARPSGGWANHPDPQVDYRLNILLLHDDRRGNRAQYEQALAQAGYDARGLYATAHDEGRPILCAACHGSNALPGTGQAGMRPLTAVVHAAHDAVEDPLTGMALGQVVNRSACYRCHPGSETRCLRGAMGAAVATDGTMAMQCQNCHGTMSAVGAAGRTGWLDQPSCQNCHSGDAVANTGQIRYATAFDQNGERRKPASDRFATNPDAPAPGFDLYRFSTGHGGLACEACHGSTHAEVPAAHGNDNVQNIALQGNAGVLSDCRTCHNRNPDTVAGGPHGMHPVGAAWVEAHEDAAEDGSGRCKSCHGADYKGTVLSAALADRELNTEFGKRTYWKGFRIGCYSCHHGPDSESGTKNRAPAVTDLALQVVPGTPRTVTLPGTDRDGNQSLTFRVVTQPQHATVGVSGNTATIFTDAAFAGTDRFTFAASDGLTDSNLGTATFGVTVTGTPPAIARIKPRSDPFRLAVTGSSFHGQLAVTIAGQPWTNVRWKSATSIVLQGGKALKALFPKNAWVPVSVTNVDDGLSVTVEFNLTTRQIR